jgi:hypothetical protein
VPDDRMDELDLLRGLGQADEPDPSSEARARALLERRISGFGRRRPWRPFHLRLGLALALALLVGSGFGFALGTASTPSGDAASAGAGLGFLPARGWNVLQAATQATQVQEAIAIAANVPISRDDAAARLPYSTMLTLPPNGVVIVANFTARGNKWRDQSYPRHALPLRLRDAAAGSIQVRPESPLGQYQLQAAVNGHNVDVNVYFGTPHPAPALITAAQRQLDRMVVRSARASDRAAERAFPIRAAGTGVVTPVRVSVRVIDRRLTCNLVSPLGSTRDLDVIASPPYVDRFRNFSIPAFLGSSSGRVLAGPVSDRANLVFVRARPHNVFGRNLPPGVYANMTSCSATGKAIALSSRGLPGPPVQFEQVAECELRGRVLIRVRASLQTSAAWRPIQEGYVGAQANVREAKLAVRSERTGRALAFMELGAAGKTRSWVSRGCS